MTKNRSFDHNALLYDQWFEQNMPIYQAELRAVREALPLGKFGVEIGVGTGRFAGRLGIELGIEPSAPMGEIAAARGVTVIRAVAENIPLAAETVDFALMVTTICFFDDLFIVLTETHRILKSGGMIVIAFIDAAGPLGPLYHAKKKNSPFYRDATFFSTADVVELMRQTHFHDFSFRQTLFHKLAETGAEEPITDGHGQGGFVVISAIK